MTLASMLEVAAFCAPHEKMLQYLLKKHQEQVVEVGVIHGGVLMELLTSETRDTWTLLAVQPTGISCVVATGVHWETVLVGSAKPGA